MAFRLLESWMKDGPKLIETDNHVDTRGAFRETYHREAFEELGIYDEFVQDNESYSEYDVLRGLHYQKVNPQAKLVRCKEGKVLDVAVDIRPDFPTFGKYISVLLDRPTRLFYVPTGFAHGFVVLETYAVVNYKCSEIYYPEYDAGIIWNDPDINIDWSMANSPKLSRKDASWPTLKETFQMK